MRIGIHKLLWNLSPRQVCFNLSMLARDWNLSSHASINLIDRFFILDQSQLSIITVDLHTRTLGNPSPYRFGRKYHAGPAGDRLALVPLVVVIARSSCG